MLGCRALQSQRSLQRAIRDGSRALSTAACQDIENGMARPAEVVQAISLAQMTLWLASVVDTVCTTQSSWDKYGATQPVSSLFNPGPHICTESLRPV